MKLTVWFRAILSHNRTFKIMEGIGTVPWNLEQIINE